MYQNSKILALITARGGSKGIPKKNIKLLGNKPLINWTIEAAKASKYIDFLALSSDDKEIIDTAIKAGCEVPFIRPVELAQDISSSMDVIMHALDNIGSDFKYLLLLQPTSPFRSTTQIDKMIEKCIEDNAKIMVSVSKSKKSPYLMFKIEDNQLTPILESNKGLRRQDLPQTYEYNGAMYLAEIDYLKETQSYNTPETKPFIMERGDLDIDEPLDWIVAETLISQNLI